MKLRHKLKHHPRTNRIMTFLLLLSLFALTACSGTSGQSQTASESKSDKETTSSAFPKTVKSGDQSVQIEKKPERILAISHDAAEAVLELTDSSRVVSIPRTMENPFLAHNSEKAKEIPNQFAGASSLDPEKILSFKPDVLFLTNLHAQEKDADGLLKQAGIPMITFGPWSTADQIANNYMTIGSAIGEEERARELVTQMKDKVKKMEEAAAQKKEKPSLLVIAPVGPNTGPYLLGKSDISYDLIRLSGASAAIDTIGLERTSPATIEQVMKADPDYMLMAAWNDHAEEDFKKLMETPGWNTLKAVKNNRTKIMEAKHVLFPSLHITEAIEEISKWMHQTAN